MYTLLALAAIPLSLVVLWISWLWVCGWIIRDAHHSYGGGYSVWDKSEHFTTIFTIFLWTSFITVTHIFICSWGLQLLQTYLLVRS